MHDLMILILGLGTWAWAWLVVLAEPSTVLAAASNARLVRGLCLQLNLLDYFFMETDNTYGAIIVVSPF